MKTFHHDPSGPDPSGPDASRSAARFSVGAVVVGAALIAWLWAGTFAEVWGRWFPNWNRIDQPLRDRLLGGDSYFSHGLLAVAAALFLAWRARSSSNGLVHVPTASSARRWPRVAGWLTLMLSLALHGLSRWAGVTFISAYALVAALAGIALVLEGGRGLKRYGWALAVAALAVPLPMVWIAQLNLHLKQVAIEGAMALAHPLVRGEIARRGSYVLLSHGGDGANFHAMSEVFAGGATDGAAGGGAAGGGAVLLIGGVCSGLRSLVALLFTATVFVALSRVRGWRGALLLLTALPLAVGLNVLRVALLIAGASWWGVAVASEGGWLHDWTGPGLFLAALTGLAMLERLFTLGRSTPGPACRVMPSTAPTGPPAGSVRQPPTRLFVPRPWAVVLVLAAAVGVSFVATGRMAEPLHAHAHADSDVPAAAGPSSRLVMTPRNTPLFNTPPFNTPPFNTPLKVAGRWIEGQPLPIDPATRRWLASGRWSYQRFASLAVDLLVIETGTQRDILHPPEVCLSGRGDELLRRDVRPGPGGVEVGELLVQRGPTRELYVYLYQCGDHTTPSFALQHARLVGRALTGRPTPGRLIRVSTALIPVAEDDWATTQAMQAARDRLDRVLAAVLRERATQDPAAAPQASARRKP